MNDEGRVITLVHSSNLENDILIHTDDDNTHISLTLPTFSDSTLDISTHGYYKNTLVMTDTVELSVTFFLENEQVTTTLTRKAPGKISTYAVYETHLIVASYSRTEGTADQTTLYLEYFDIDKNHISPLVTYTTTLSNADDIILVGQDGAHQAIVLNDNELTLFSLATDSIKPISSITLEDSDSNIIIELHGVYGTEIAVLMEIDHVTTAATINPADGKITTLGTSVLGFDVSYTGDSYAILTGTDNINVTKGIETPTEYHVTAVGYESASLWRFHYKSLHGDNDVVVSS